MTGGAGRGGGAAGIGTISWPAPSTTLVLVSAARGASGSGGGAAVGVLRRGTTSSVDPSMEIRGICEIGDGIGALGALAGIGVMMSVGPLSGRKNAESPNNGAGAGAAGSIFARRPDGVGCGSKTSCGTSGVLCRVVSGMRPAVAAG